MWELSKSIVTGFITGAASALAALTLYDAFHDDVQVILLFLLIVLTYKTGQVFYLLKESKGSK